MGIYILYTILSPEIRLITGSDIKIDYSDYEKYFGNLETSVNIEAPNVEDTYTIELEKQIKKDLENQGYLIHKIKAELNLNEGKIKNISITINKDGKKDTNIYVNKIEIGEKNEKSDLDTKLIEEIKQKINTDYGVDYENITVN